MPSIAQQDYIIIRPVIESSISTDAIALAEVAKHLKRGTIFDCLLETSSVVQDLARVLNVKQNKQVCLIFGANFSINSITIRNTPTQYEGLAAIQKAYIEEEGEEYGGIPALSYNRQGENYLLTEDLNGYYLTDENGNCVDVTTDSDDDIAALSRTTIPVPADGDFLKVNFDDLLKLIGLPLV